MYYGSKCCVAAVVCLACEVVLLDYGFVFFICISCESFIECIMAANVV